VTTTKPPDVLGVGTWRILPDQSSVSFSVRNFMVAKVQGQFERFTGAIEIGSNSTPLAAARIDIRSVTTGNDKRDEHLQAPGFFDSEHHPEALFASASILPVRGGYLLNGDLTIKGMSKPVSLHLQYNGVGPDPRYRQVSRFTASITLDRKEFDVDYRLPLGLGDFIIGPTVTAGSSPILSSTATPKGIR
jgi:polyisoprenoid-binding protein YceI